MSHLGDRLSALVDGELGGAELDRAHAHLAGCEPCRAEAAMTRRLIAMTGPGGPVPPRRRLLRVVPGRRPAKPATGPASSRPASGPTAEPRSPFRPQPTARRRRYLVLGTVSLVVGLGTAAFTVGGGGDAAPGPRITPPVEMYSVEHAITTGEVPFPGPTAGPSSAPSSLDGPPP